MKKILIFVFGRQSKIVKYFLVLKNNFVNLKKILPLVKSNKLKFILKTFQGQNYVEFQPNIDNEKI